METNELDKDFTRIKRTLEQMGYKNQFGTESLGLITRLLNDIIKAGEACKKFKSEREKLASDLRVQGDITLPLRNENVKLTKENNKLHREIIQIKDALDVRNAQNDSSMSKLEAEKEEMKLVITQKDCKIKALESEGDGLKRKLNDIFSKLYMGEATKSKINPGQGIPNASKLINKDTMMNNIGKKNAFHMSTNLIGTELMNGTPLDKFQEELHQVRLSKEAWANDLRLADERAEKLQNEIKQLRLELNSKTEMINSLKKSMATRDIEIQRMEVANYIGDDNRDELKLKYQSDTLQLQNEKLNQQIEFLNKENHRLHQIDYMHNHRCHEEEIKKLDETIIKLTKENEGYKKGKISLGTQQTQGQVQGQSNISKTGVQSVSDVSNNSTLGLNTRNMSVLQTMKKNSNRLENELKFTKDNLHTVSKSLLAIKEELNHTISSFNTERASFVKRIETLINEINALKAEKEKKTKEAMSSNDQADDYKSELNLLKANDIIKSKVNKEKEDYVNEIIDDYSKIKNEIKLLRTKVSILEKENKELNEQNSLSRKLKEEIEQKDKEISDLKSGANVMPSHNQNNNFQSFGQEELQPKIDTTNLLIKHQKIEKELSEYKQTTKLLQEDKNTLTEEISKARQELLSANKEIQDNTMMKEALDEMKEKNTRVTNDLIKLKNDVERSKNDLSSLEFELKKKEIENNKLSETIHQLKLDNAQVKSEKNTLVNSNEQMKGDIVILQGREKALISQTSESSEIKSKLMKANNSITEMQTKLNLSKQSQSLLEKDNESLQNKILQINQVINDSDKFKEELTVKMQSEAFRSKTLEAELRALQDTLMQLKEQNSRLMKENNEFKHSIKAIDSNCMHLTNDLDKKTELMSRMEIDHQNKSSLLNELNAKLKSAMSKASIDLNRLNEREIQLNETKTQLSHYENDIHQLKGLLSERNKEIQDIGYENGQLKNKSDKMIEDIKRLAKENERLEIIKNQLEQNTDFFKTKNITHEYDLNEMNNHLKQVNKDKEKLKKNLQLFADENREAAKHIQLIEDQLSQYDATNRNLMNDKEALIEQIETVEKYNSNLTEEIQRLKEEMSHLKLASNNCIKQNKMDQNINKKYEEYIASLNSQLAQKENDIKFLQGKVEELAVRSEMNSNERETYDKKIRNYEEIIDEERRRNINSMNVLRQKETNANATVTNSSDEDNVYLKKLINDLHYKIDGLNNELQGLKNENTQLKSINNNPITYELNKQIGSSNEENNQMGLSSDQHE